MKTKMILLSVLIAFITTGCSKYEQLKPNQAIQISAQDKIGYFIESSDTIMFRHRGEEFEKNYALSWSAQKDAEIILRKRIPANWVNLSQQNFGAQALLQVFKKYNGQYIVRDMNLYNYLLRALQLKAIVVLQHDGEPILDGETLYIDKPSLIGVSHFGLKRYLAISSYHYYIIDLAHPSIYSINSAHNTLLYNSIYASYAQKSGFQVPRNIHNVTEAEFMPVRRSIDMMLQEATAKVALSFRRY